MQIQEWCVSELQFKRTYCSSLKEKGGKCYVCWRRPLWRYLWKRSCTCCTMLMPFKTENNYCFIVRPLSLAPLSFLKEVCPDVTLHGTKQCGVINLYRWSICKCWIFGIAVLITLPYSTRRIMWAHWDIGLCPWTLQRIVSEQNWMLHWQACLVISE